MSLMAGATRGRSQPEQLKILELAYFSGYTQREQAGMLDLPLATVEGRMRPGLRKSGGFLRAGGAAGRICPEGPSGRFGPARSSR